MQCTVRKREHRSLLECSTVWRTCPISPGLPWGLSKSDRSLQSTWGSMCQLCWLWSSRNREGQGKQGGTGKAGGREALGFHTQAVSQLCVQGAMDFLKINASSVLKDNSLLSTRPRSEPLPQDETRARYGKKHRHGKKRLQVDRDLIVNLQVGGT